MILHVSGKTYEECLVMADNARLDGSAYKKLCDMVTYQGGNIDFLNDTSLLPTAKYLFEFVSPSEGYIEKMNTEKIGLVSVILGAGREKKEDSIDFGAGIILHKKTGCYIKKDESIATFYSCHKESFIYA